MREGRGKKMRSRNSNHNSVKGQKLVKTGKINCPPIKCKNINNIGYC